MHAIYCGKVLPSMGEGHAPQVRVSVGRCVCVSLCVCGAVVVGVVVLMVVVVVMVVVTLSKKG